MSLVSAKVIGSGITYSVYANQAPNVRRGHLEFIMSRGEIRKGRDNWQRWVDGYQLEDKPTKSNRWGNLIECLAGLNGDFEARYAVAPADYTDKGMECPSCKSVTDAKTCRACKCDRVEIKIVKPWNSGASVCEKWESEQGEREVIHSELLEKAKLAVFNLEADLAVSELFHCSKKQVMVIGIYKVGDVEIPIRCLLDLVPAASHPRFNKCLADFKTDLHADPNWWYKTVDDDDYDVQAALGLDLYAKATGEDRTDWLHPLQQNVHPYHVVSPMPGLTQEFIQWGRAKYQTALADYAACLASGKWTSFSTGTRAVLNNPPCQLVGPEKIYAYREAGGTIASQQEYEPEPPRPEHSDVGH